jgi:formamidopyrimidine-DNA glycosylase
LKAALEHQTLEQVSRAGKTLQLHFSGGQVLGIHLMLRGELVSLANDGPPRFQILAFHFKGGKGFAVIDLQKQATPTLNPQPVTAPDALELDEAWFKVLLAKKRTVIKTLLMDQKVMRGIGNSYADEILYDAGISPFSVAQAIPPVAVKRLFKSIDMVLHTAIQEIADANGDELTGELKDLMRVHSAKLKKTAKGEAIQSGKIGGRTTYYTDAQELFS